MNKPNILITNDDGIYSEGIYALWEAMGEVGNPFVVAPNTCLLYTSDAADE